MSNLTALSGQRWILAELPYTALSARYVSKMVFGDVEGASVGMIHAMGNDVTSGPCDLSGYACTRLGYAIEGKARMARSAAVKMVSLRTGKFPHPVESALRLVGWVSDVTPAARVRAIDIVSSSAVGSSDHSKGEG